jgi:hypothetical protein
MCLLYFLLVVKSGGGGGDSLLLDDRRLGFGMVGVASRRGNAATDIGDSSTTFCSVDLRLIITGADFGVGFHRSLVLGFHRA